ncbi:hypothetical protein SLS62_001575 [Diatrype stigma]|uniref:Uncharacterized protein n=1 Tax=Diatrype stigma TaxID=117547 RepID=A0AAN9YVW4_9PEZI
MDKLSSWQAWDAERKHIAQKYELQRTLCEKDLNEAKEQAYKWRDAKEKDWRSRFTPEDYAAIAPSLEENMQNRLEKAAQTYLQRMSTIEQECRKETDRHNNSWDTSTIVLPKESSIASKSSPAPTKSSGSPNKVITSEGRMLATINTSKRKGSPGPTPKPKRPRIKTSIPENSLLRTPSATPQSITKPLTDRTITFDAVFNNSEHKDFIMEYPRDSGNFYVLYCQEHQVHFTRSPAQGAAKHINGQMHGFLPKHYDVAVQEVGYLVIDCNQELANRHNREVDRAYEKGYKPENPLQCKKIRRASTKKPPFQKSTGSAGETRIATKSSSFKGIINPRTYNVYCAYWTDTRAMYPVLILGWDKQEEAGLEATLADTPLLDKSSSPPKCYIYDQDKIVGWAPGFEDGGAKVKSRQFPVMWFDDVHSWGWVDAASLREFSDYTPRPRLKKYFDVAYRWIAERGTSSPLQKREDMHGTIRQGTATGQETFPVTKRDGSSVKQDFRGESPKAHIPGAFDGELDDPELRRLAEKGGDTSSDEDYESSCVDRADIENLALHESRTTYRKSFFSFRNSSHSDHTAVHDQPSEGVPANNKPPPTPLSAPARPEPPSIKDFPFERPKVPQARALSQEVFPMPSTSLSKTDSQGDGPIAANPWNAQKADQAPAIVTGLRGSMAESTVTTSENNSVQRKYDHDSTLANPEEQKTSEEQTLSRDLPDNATPNRSSEPGRPEMPQYPSGPAKFAISQYTHGAVNWKKANLGGHCIPLYCSTDMKSVFSKGGAINIKIAATELRTFVREIDEETNGNGILTLIFQDTTTPPVKLVFDRDSGANNINLGKKQARVFTNWLRDCNIRPGRQ